MPPSSSMKREGTSQRRDCASSHLQVLKSQVWHEMCVWDDSESDIRSGFSNGLDYVLIAANYREIRSSSQSLFKGSDSQQEGRFRACWRWNDVLCFPPLIDTPWKWGYSAKTLECTSNCPQGNRDFSSLQLLNQNTRLHSDWVTCPRLEQLLLPGGNLPWLAWAGFLPSLSQSLWWEECLSPIRVLPWRRAGLMGKGRGMNRIFPYPSLWSMRFLRPSYFIFIQFEAWLTVEFLAERLFRKLLI